MEETNELYDVQLELSTKIKLPKSEKLKIYKKMFYNLLLALGVLIYFIFLDLGYLKLEADVLKNDLKVFAVILLGFTIYFIEKAYHTSKGTYAVHAAELMILSIITLYMPYVYFYHNKIAQFIFSTSAVYLAIYYIIKCIIMYFLYKKRYITNASDISEIVRDMDVSYLDEDSFKIIGKKVEEKKKIEKEELAKEKEKKAKEKKAKKEKKKKETKEAKKEDKKEVEVDEKPQKKKRGRPKKKKEEKKGE